MAGSTFQTNPIDLNRLLDECHRGVIQLPDFQRSWVWDEDRIKSLIASISRAFPVGALMSLDTGGPVNFKPRPIEGAPATARQTPPQSLLLDGQQRMTSLYQVTLRGKVVETVTPKKKKVRRWFYIDIQKALDETLDREEAIVGVPEDKIERTDFGREITRDLSTPEKEYAALMYPVSQVFDWDKWQDGFDEFWAGDQNKKVRESFRTFKREILENFKYYRVPVIALDRSTSKEAVCVVFEKVNTGGKALDAFELVTAMYAASGHELRKDWYGDDGTKGRHRRLADALRPADSEGGILASVSNTDFLQAVSLFYTRERRRAAEMAGKQGKELPAISGNRQALLDLPLHAYKQFEAKVEHGFTQSAKFLHMLHIYRIFDLPYQSQIVPLAAILADIGDAWEHDATRAKLVQWYWNGVFGELYGSAVESRIARDFMEVPAWLKGGPEPSTVSETIFRADRLKTMRMRLSAAYKGMNALLMKEVRKTSDPVRNSTTPFSSERTSIFTTSSRRIGARRRVSNRRSSIPSSIRRRSPTGRTGSSAVSRRLSTSQNWRRVTRLPRRSRARSSTSISNRIWPTRHCCAPINSQRSWTTGRSSCWPSSSRPWAKPLTPAASQKRARMLKLTRTRLKPT